MTAILSIQGVRKTFGGVVANNGISLDVPEGKTKCWNVKDVVRIEVTTGARPDTVPTTPRPRH